MSLKRFFNCSVSSFAVDKDGRLTLVDCKPTGNAVKGKSGTAKSLAYSPAKDMLYAVHSFGLDHIRPDDGSTARASSRLGWSGYLTGKNWTQRGDR
jgi:hypothetical protein